MAAITAALIAATAIAAGTSAYGSYESSKAADDAKNVASKSEFEAKAAADEAAKQAQTEKDQRAQIDEANKMRDRQSILLASASKKRILYGNDFTKNGTLLTGPQGVTTPGATSNKTLLGA